MKNMKAAELIEQLAASVMAAEVSDIDSIEKIGRILSELALLTADAAGSSVVENARAARQLVREVLSSAKADETPSEPEKLQEVLDKLCALVEIMQRNLTETKQKEPSAMMESEHTLIALQNDEETCALVGDFLQEADEGLLQVDEILMVVERGDLTEEQINSLFRVFHTIKGVSGFLELRGITKLAHATESMLNQVRNGVLKLAGHVLEGVFDATSMMRRLLEQVKKAVEAGSGYEPTIELESLIEHIEILAGASASQQEAPQSPEALKQSAATSVTPTAEVQKLADTAAPVTPKGESLAEIPTPAETPADRQETKSSVVLGEEIIQIFSKAKGEVQRPPNADLKNPTRKPAQAESGRVFNKIREYIKVDLERVDTLVEAIGELVIVESMVMHAPEVGSIESSRVRNYLNQMGKITRDLQAIGMQMRMVPVRNAFKKIARMARDLARRSGKSIEIDIEGEDTEIDRTMVDQLSDPLVHLIRNAVDHGIESPQARTHAGKPPAGKIRLTARHENGKIVIEVSDDGAGLDREKILEKAISQGVIADGDGMSAQDVYALIFSAGFSTAQKISEISGRGVGMDVVRRNIEELRGRIQVQTALGQGTKFRCVLPLTLAIIDGMLVSCGPERFILPTLAIVESISPRKNQIALMAGKGEVINVRGEIMPLQRLDKSLHISGAKEDPVDALVVIVESLGRKVGLMVDDVITQQQVVIKNLGDGFESMRFLSGAAILSDGKVGLILNVDELAMIACDLKDARKVRVA